MTTNNDSKIYFKIEVGWGVLILIIIAMIIYILTEYYQAVKTGQSFTLSVAIVQGISAIIINVIVIALVSLIIEITTLKKYSQSIAEQTALSFKTFVNEQDYSKMQTYELTEHLDSVIFNLACKKRFENNINLQMKKEDICDYNLCLIPKLIEDLVIGEYYEDYDINLRLKIVDQDKVLFTISTSYIIHNSTNKSFDFRATYPSIITCDSLKFDKLIISSTDRKNIYYDLTKEINANIKLIDIKSKQHHHNVYCLNSKVNFYDLQPNDYYIEFSRSYLKYIKNGVLVHSLPKPVKNFRADFWLENDIENKYKIYGISFFPYKQVTSQLDLKLSEITNTPHNMTFRNQNWCLPGSGFTMTLLENLDQTEDMDRYYKFKEVGKL